MGFIKEIRTFHLTAKQPNHSYIIPSGMRRARAEEKRQKNIYSLIMILESTEFTQHLVRSRP